jgi:6-pyruvoyltetrahydropterin/6-carboxytetrahydropterin synthase
VSSGVTSGIVRTVKHRIEVAREQYKFSCAHMTVFADGSKERLHGHNYTIAIALEVSSIELAHMVPFSSIKHALRELCATWKEHVMLATKNPFFVIKTEAPELEFTLCGERYVMPRGDALLLPLDNISVETLAAHVAELLAETINAPTAISLEVTIEESPGQGASATLTF